MTNRTPSGGFYENKILGHTPEDNIKQARLSILSSQIDTSRIIKERIVRSLERIQSISDVVMGSQPKSGESAVKNAGGPSGQIHVLSDGLYGIMDALTELEHEIDRLEVL